MSVKPDHATVQKSVNSVLTSDACCEATERKSCLRRAREANGSAVGIAAAPQISDRAVPVPLTAARDYPPLPIKFIGGVFLGVLGLVGSASGG
jgi:hypothetical protein